MSLADDDSPCPPHCCCCGPGDPCCDCGRVIPTIEGVFRAGFFAGATHGIDYQDMGTTPIDGESQEDKAWNEFKERRL
jgi:hypothetical protein